jgi:hypothetical protein
MHTLTASRRRPATLAAVALAALALPAAANARNLLKDSSFEKPLAPSGFWSLYSPGTTISAWHVVGATGNVALVSGTFSQNGCTFPADKGAQWLDLTGVSQTATGVEQTVRTVAGSRYTLAFSVGNVVNPGGIFGTSSTVNVLLNGSPLTTATYAGGGTTQTWKRFSVSFTAPTTATTITFLNGDPPSDTDNGVDRVSLIAG